MDWIFGQLCGRCLLLLSLSLRSMKYCISRAVQYSKPGTCKTLLDDLLLLLQQPSPSVFFSCLWFLAPVFRTSRDKQKHSLRRPPTAPLFGFFSRCRSRSLRLRFKPGNCDARKQPNVAWRARKTKLTRRSVQGVSSSISRPQCDSLLPSRDGEHASRYDACIGRPQHE